MINFLIAVEVFFRSLFLPFMLAGLAGFIALIVFDLKFSRGRDRMVRAVLWCFGCGIAWRLILQTGSSRYFVFLDLLLIVMSILAMERYCKHISQKRQWKLLPIFFALIIAVMVCVSIGRIMSIKSNYAATMQLLDTLAGGISDSAYTAIYDYTGEGNRFRYYLDRKKPGYRGIWKMALEQDIDKDLPEAADNYTEVWFLTKDRGGALLQKSFERNNLTPFPEKIQTIAKSKSREWEIYRWDNRLGACFGSSSAPVEVEAFLDQSFHHSDAIAISPQWQDKGGELKRTGAMVSFPNFELHSILSCTEPLQCSILSLTDGGIRLQGGGFLFTVCSLAPARELEMRIVAAGKTGAEINLNVYYYQKERTLEIVSCALSRFNGKDGRLYFCRRIPVCTKGTPDKMIIRLQTYGDIDLYRLSLIAVEKIKR